jgi:RND family efflux transporter MFP subunit
MIRAPFAGVVTQRHADVGALVTNATSNQTAALPVVTVADVSRLKVTVYVPQAEAPQVRPGLQAEIVDAAASERRAAGTVARVSGELDTRTRTLRTEVEFDNRDGAFIPGSFVNVVLAIPVVRMIEVPAAALVMREGKPFVVRVDADNKARFVPVDVASTDGKMIQVARGIEDGTRVAVGPPASLVDGDKVDPQPPPTVAAHGGPSTGGKK